MLIGADEQIVSNVTQMKDFPNDLYTLTSIEAEVSITWLRIVQN